MTQQLDIGSWGLFCGQEGRQLVLIDDQPCGPVSARKVMRTVPRRLLLDETRVARAIETGQLSTETVAYRDTNWVVTVCPLSSPRTSSIIGVLAVVTRAGQPVPPTPLVGTWEWEIKRSPEGEPTPHRRTYWDRNLFHIYDVDPSVAQQRRGYWEAGEWANELIVQADQMRVNSSIRNGIQDGLHGVTGLSRCLTYNVITGYGTNRTGHKHLRFVGIVAPVNPDDEEILLRGFSYEVPSWFHDMAFEQDVNAARVDDVLRGVIELVGEPMAVLDAATLGVLMTSPSWRQLDLGHVGGFDDFVIDDSETIHNFIASADDDTEGSRSMAVQLRRADGSVQGVLLTAKGVRSGTQGHDAVIRLDL